MRLVGRRENRAQEKRSRDRENRSRDHVHCPPGLATRDRHGHRRDGERRRLERGGVLRHRPEQRRRAEDQDDREQRNGWRKRSSQPFVNGNEPNCSGGVREEWRRRAALNSRQQNPQRQDPEQEVAIWGRTNRLRHAGGAVLRYPRRMANGRESLKAVRRSRITGKDSDFKDSNTAGCRALAGGERPANGYGMVTAISFDGPLTPQALTASTRAKYAPGAALPLNTVAEPIGYCSRFTRPGADPTSRR